MRRDLCDNAFAEILHPTDPDEELLNDASVVVRLVPGDVIVLLAGDIERKSEEEAQVSVPLSELPEGAGEGIWLDISFSINSKLTDDQYRKNRDLLDKIKRKKSGG